MEILNLNKSNDEIIKLLQRDKPFSIVRLGSCETKITIEYLKTKKINPKFISNNNGIYSKTKDKNKFEIFCISHNEAIKNSDLLASFINLNFIKPYQDFFAKKYNLTQINSRSLEPFYQLQEDIKPWTHYLYGKKVLIINPFVDSFQKQINNGFQIFKDKKVFLDGQEFVFYKSYQTIAGNHIHNDWLETFTIMCNDIKKLDFDIALLGCGGYGLPLCNFIKTKLNKSAIYIGGGLQLLFGVMGKRWENREMWKKIIKENDTKFIRPSGDERCKNLSSIEQGCYW